MEVANQINEVIDKIADKAGLAVDQVKPLAEQVVREYATMEYATAWFFAALAVVAVILMIGAVIGIRSICRNQNKRDSTSCTEAEGCGLAVSSVSGAAGLIMFIVALVNGVDAIRGTFAPTYWCVKELLA